MIPLAARPSPVLVAFIIVVPPSHESARQASEGGNREWISRGLGEDCQNSDIGFGPEPPILVQRAMCINGKCSGIKEALSDFKRSIPLDFLDLPPFVVGTDYLLFGVLPGLCHFGIPASLDKGGFRCEGIYAPDGQVSINGPE